MRQKHFFVVVFIALHPFYSERICSLSLSFSHQNYAKIVAIARWSGQIKCDENEGNDDDDDPNKVWFSLKANCNLCCSIDYLAWLGLYGQILEVLSKFHIVIEVMRKISKRVPKSTLLDDEAIKWFYFIKIHRLNIFGWIGFFIPSHWIVHSKEHTLQPRQHAFNDMILCQNLQSIQVFVCRFLPLLLMLLLVVVVVFRLLNYIESFKCVGVCVCVCLCEKNFHENWSTWNTQK